MKDEQARRVDVLPVLEQIPDAKDALLLRGREEPSPAPLVACWRRKKWRRIPGAQSRLPRWWRSW